MCVEVYILFCTVNRSYQISYIRQVLVGEHRFSIKLSYVDETVQYRPCCLITHHWFLLIHAAHSHTLQTALFRCSGNKLVVLKPFRWRNS